MGSANCNPGLRESPHSPAACDDYGRFGKNSGSLSRGSGPCSRADPSVMKNAGVDGLAAEAEAEAATTTAAGTACRCCSHAPAAASSMESRWHRCAANKARAATMSGRSGAPIKIIRFRGCIDSAATCTKPDTLAARARSGHAKACNKRAAAAVDSGRCINPAQRRRFRPATALAERPPASSSDFRKTGTSDWPRRASKYPPPRSSA